MARRRLSLRARILLGYGLLLLAFGGLVAVVLVQMGRTQAALATLSGGYLPLSREVSAAESGALGLELEPGQSAVRLARLRRTESTLIERRLAQLGRARDLASALADSELIAGDRQVLGAVRDQLDELLDLLDDYAHVHEDLVARVEAGEDADPHVLELIRLRGSVDEGLRRLDRRVNRRLSRVLQTTQRAQQQAVVGVAGLSALVFLLGVLLLLGTGYLLRPVRALIASAERLRHGHFDEPLAVSSDDEVGRLARSFNAMAAAIAEREGKLALRGEQLEKALAELRASQQQVVRAERLATIGSMAAQIAHEVRNPLNALGLNVDLLVEELHEGGAGADELVDAIRGEVARLVRITEDYLAVGRAPAIRPEPYPLGVLVRELVRFQAEELERAGIDVSVDVPDTLPEVALDPAQMRQALLNLVRNALEAMPEGGRLRIDAAEEGGGILLRLADDGPGIDDAHLAAIFDPFFTTKERGSGLGLPLTQQVIHEHGGRLECVSRPGEGTRFEVWLPG